MTNFVTVERLTPGHREGVAYLLQELRPEDQFEFSCAGITDVAPLLDFLLTCPDAWLFRFKGEPVFVWGTAVVQPHVRWLWGFGTKRTWRIMPFATKWGRDWWLPEMFDEGATRRVEVRVPLKSQHSISWLMKLGMVPECWTLQDHSVNGEPVTQLAYTTREYRKRHVHFPEATSPDDYATRPREDQRRNSGVDRGRAVAEPA